MTTGAEIRAFACGHPRTRENSYVAPSSQHAICRLCNRVRMICKAVLRDQARINAGEPLRPRPGPRYYRYG